MFRAHVLIIRRSKLYYIASGIITPIGGRLVHSCARDGHFNLNLQYCTESPMMVESDRNMVLYQSKER